MPQFLPMMTVEDPAENHATEHRGIRPATDEEPEVKPTISQSPPPKLWKFTIKKKIPCSGNNRSFQSRSQESREGEGGDHHGISSFGDDMPAGRSSLGMYEGLLETTKGGLSAERTVFGLSEAHGGMEHQSPSRTFNDYGWDVISGSPANHLEELSYLFSPHTKQVSTVKQAKREKDRFVESEVDAMLKRACARYEDAVGQLRADLEAERRRTEMLEAKVQAQKSIITQTHLLPIRVTPASSHDSSLHESFRAPIPQAGNQPPARSQPGRQPPAKVQAPAGLHVMIALLCASHLPLTDKFRLCDPFCRIKIGDQARETATQWQTLNPSWNEEFLFRSQDVRQERVKLQIFDRNAVTAGKLIGVVDVPLRKLVAEQNRRKRRRSASICGKSACELNRFKFRLLAADGTPLTGSDKHPAELEINVVFALADERGHSIGQVPSALLEASTAALLLKTRQLDYYEP